MIQSKKIDLKSDNKNVVLKKGQELTFKLDGSNINTNNLHKLFFSCEDASAPTLKNESGAELLYMLIDDSLNYEESKNNRFCLDYSTQNPLPYAKRVLKKVVWQGLLYGLFPYEDFTEYSDEWSFGMSAKARNLKIEDGGYVRIILDVWYTKDGISPNDTTAAPDERHIINVPEGTYDFTELKKHIKIEQQKTACVIITLEGENYSGNLYFESPFICDTEGRNLLPEFDRGNIGLTRFAWLGQNLSKRDWPEFEISVNGNLCYKGEVFLKIHRFSPVEIELPEGVFTNGENTISIKYTSNYHDVIPLLFDEILVLEKENTPFTLMNSADEFYADKDLKLLVETKNNDVNIEFESSDFELTEKTVFDEVNLVVLSLKPLKAKNGLSFTLKSDSFSKSYTMRRCVSKTNDNVITASGDMIYIDVSSLKSVCDYIKWYIANDIGSFITIRPVYRWGGQRFVNSRVWNVFTRLCEKLELNYVHISDGRDIPGVHTNPSEKMLSGKHFMGRQLHERDGQLFYWTQENGRPREIEAPLEEFYDLAARLAREYPETIESSYRPFNIMYKDGEYSYARKTPESNDMAMAHDIASQELKLLSSGNFTRHTGPSVMYKYFLQNGFEWVGTETMDSSTEILLSFLRGASQAYNKDKYGVHLALQWSTFPHDNLRRYRRYLLSLYVPYLQGVTDINTEEGLWFMEAFYAYHNRLSLACEKHREELLRFNKFVRTHSRTGTFYTPFAFLHGRMDGWNGFLVNTQWGIPSIKPGDESDSWIHLKSFYPLDALNEQGAHKTGFVSPQRDVPFGTFSGTPRGNVDAVPVETGDLSKYALLVFAGYNYSTVEDTQRILNAVENGSTLICTWAHFTDTTNKDELDNFNINVVSNPITDKLANGAPKFESKNIAGTQIKVCVNLSDNLKKISPDFDTEDVVYELECGKGKIILVNTLCYPGNKAIYSVYNNLIKSCADEILKNEKVRVECGDDVQYSIFKQEDNTYHIYLTAVDWYNTDDTLRKAKVVTKNTSFDVEMPFGKIVKIVTDTNTFVWPENELAEVVCVNQNSFTAQGEAKERFYVAQNSNIKEYVLDFSDSNLQEQKI